MHGWLSISSAHVHAKREAPQAHREGEDGAGRSQAGDDGARAGIWVRLRRTDGMNAEEKYRVELVQK